MPNIWKTVDYSSILWKSSLAKKKEAKSSFYKFDSVLTNLQSIKRLKRSFTYWHKLRGRKCLSKLWLKMIINETLIREKKREYLFAEDDKLGCLMKRGKFFVQPKKIRKRRRWENSFSWHLFNSWKWTKEK